MALRILEAARRDMREISNWYMNRGADLALRFLDDLDSAFESIEADPQRLPAEQSNSTDRDVRYHSLKRFPYRVLVEIRDRNAAVIAIIHHHRRPGFWQNRLSN